MGKARVVLPVVALVAVQLLCTQLDLPLGKLVRNVPEVFFSAAKPDSVVPKYTCDVKTLASEVTVVVTVKDACSQMPGFVDALLGVVGPSTPLILTYPRFSWCDPAAMGVKLDEWANATTIALEPSSSPIQGWLDAAPLVRTPYALLMHNDGYALDPFFACELVEALKARPAEDHFVVAAPMLYESKADGSLAAHATQSRLRVQDGFVRHDHSAAKALDRGMDRPEGEQADFLEDHGFLIETRRIADVVDAEASYTLEYVDMILSLKQRGWKVLYVPTARLEFRISEFTYRDVPYFAYKRSEATCHETRDYLTRKWTAKWPNTGFWTYIKYTIVESHEYGREVLATLPDFHRLSLALGFFQLAGYNRYAWTTTDEEHEYVKLLSQLDDAHVIRGLDGTIVASRRTARSEPRTVRPVLATAAELLPAAPVWKQWLPSLEADLPLEYMPFAVAEVAFPGDCFDRIATTTTEGRIPGTLDAAMCGIALQHSTSCSCWINLPTFKTRGFLVDKVAKAASVLRLPSRVTMYIELILGSANAAEAHVRSLRDLGPLAGNATLRVATCGGAKDGTAALIEPCAPLAIAYDPKATTLVHFSGRPQVPTEVAKALAQLA